MSTPVGDALPPEMVRAFDGTDLASKIGPAHLLVTTDEDGTPRPCMLSAGEILAVGEDRLRVAVWGGSRTSGNLRRGAPTLLCYLDTGTVIYVKGVPAPMEGPDDGLDRFEITVAVVERDEHVGMPMLSGPTFTLEGQTPAEVVEWWTRQVDSLR